MSARAAGTAQKMRQGRVAVVYRPIAELKLDPHNPRVHSPRQIRQIARSIEAFGFNVPVLIDANLKLIAGHGRVLAARQLGIRPFCSTTSPKRRRAPLSSPITS